ncbi:hypothetical protein [Kitasatospora sp. NPDC088134]|uniref:hypothetical protein n=1 Tax=Kitasatospora sp. NPDC088134 TaxID=3364071 RepID=UPI003829F35D
MTIHQRPAPAACGGPGAEAVPRARPGSPLLEAGAPTLGPAGPADAPSPGPTP